jgi:RNase P subunit RPR2
MKWFLSIDMRFLREKPDGSATTMAYFKTSPTIALNPTETRTSLEDGISRFQNLIDNFTSDGSGWVIDEIVGLKLHMATYDPIGGSSYIPTPKWIAIKKATVNIKNSDNHCFLYCMLSVSHHQKNNAHNISYYSPYLKELNVQSLAFPLPIAQIPTFEENNPDFSVNVIYPNSDDKTFAPLYASPHRNRRHVVNLLLLDEGERRHYVVIRKLSALLATRNSHNGKSFPCPYCLHCFTTESGIQTHIPECARHGLQNVKYPTETNNILKFTNRQNEFPVGFAIYSDFECMLEKIDDDETADHGSSTKFWDTHNPSGFCCLTVSSFDRYNREQPYVYSGPKVMEAFFVHLKSEQVRINRILAKNKKMKKMTKLQIENYTNCRNCPSCNINLGAHNKVRHHCHVTGDYISTLCSKCNFQMKFKKRSHGKEDQNYIIPVIFHNLKGYDSHIILKNLSRFFAPNDVNVIATNMEKYLSFEIEGLRFLDSLQFLNCSLDILVQNLAKEGQTKFIHMKRLYPNDEQFKLLLRKGVFPYEHMTNKDRLTDTCLPSQTQFYSHLTDDTVSDADYSHAQDIWAKFGMNNMQEYHDLYLQTDVILLTDVFEEFRKMSLNFYKLDPLHYYSSPGLSWDACLRMTDVSLELLTDPDKYLFIEKGMRGGVSMISNRYAKANNKYLVQGYDENVEPSYIMYLDCNNLYGYAMCEPLPTGQFRFLDPDEREDFDLHSKSAEDCKGYILEVDLDYPTNLHHSHNDYPLAPEKAKVTPHMLSPYALDLAKKLKIGQGKTEKLVPNFYAKTSYVVHYRNLKYYLELGMKLTKIHKILEFEQSRWMKPYIDFNTAKRQVASSSFEKDLFKLMNNSCYGKTLQNNRKHLNVKIVTNARSAKRFIARPTFQSFNIVNDEVTVIKLLKTDVFLNKPIYVGMSILDISKLCMYRFHYDHIVNMYGERAKLLFTDTDSLTYHIRTDDVYADMQQHMSVYDTSDYPTDHFLYSKTNAKVIGKFKDEANSAPPLEFVGLRSKMYSLLLPNSKEKKTCKGVKRSYVSKVIRHKMYRDCLFNETPTSSNFFVIRSTKHELHTTEITKAALSPYDDKRYLLNNVDSLAYGHCDIPTSVD